MTLTENGFIRVDLLRLCRKLRHFKEAREFCDLCATYSSINSRRFDVRQCLKNLEAAQNLHEQFTKVSLGGFAIFQEFEATVLNSLSLSMSVLYARATDPKGRKDNFRLGDWIVSESEKREHQQILDVRNKVHGHTVKDFEHETGLWAKDRLFAQIDILQRDRTGIGLQARVYRVYTRAEIAQATQRMAKTLNNRFTRFLEEKSKKMLLEAGKLRRFEWFDPQVHASTLTNEDLIEESALSGYGEGAIWYDKRVHKGSGFAEEIAE